MKQGNRLAVVAARPTPHQAPVGDPVAAIAALGASVVSGGRCAIAWSRAGAQHVVQGAGNDTRWNGVVLAGLAALDNRLSDFAANRSKQVRNASRSSVESATSIQRVALSAHEIDAIVRTGIQDAPVQVAASAFADSACAVRIVLVGEQVRPLRELEALLEVIARAVFSETALESARASAEFLRSYVQHRARDASNANTDLSRERSAARDLDAAVASLRQSPAKDRFARFGELVAAHSAFDQSIVAIAEQTGFNVAAACASMTDSDLRRMRSSLEETFHRQIVIPHADLYLRIPFDAGAVALCSHESRDEVARASAEAIVARLGPIVTGWVMERDAASRRTLVRQLALRMFTPIDEERARIARDLHGDQAQLLAAAKIALEGGREEARAIFQQIEDELRRRIRELRPATLSRATLDDAIEREIRRLRGAGLDATLVHAGAAHASVISRPVQQLCFQVVREALSNVIRHARAKSVEVLVERTPEAARISISDDGRGIDPSNCEGSGLSGVRERLELMGGSLTVDSQAGRTTIVAEIPEP